MTNLNCFVEGHDLVTSMHMSGCSTHWDFWFSAEMSASSVLQSCHVHMLFLDATYCNPQIFHFWEMLMFSFPQLCCRFKYFCLKWKLCAVCLSKARSSNSVCCRSYSSRSFQPKILFLIGICAWYEGLGASS